MDEDVEVADERGYSSVEDVEFSVKREERFGENVVFNHKRGERFDGDLATTGELDAAGKRDPNEGFWHEAVKKSVATYRKIDLETMVVVAVEESLDLH